nr:L-histidine N(alpha)-methyltransferase [Allorhodopirellula heiligendammensis]
MEGLQKPKKTLPCKYFYDGAGSRLFDEICELDEYYLTRTELAITSENADAIAHQIDRRVMLIEFGSGSSIKTRILLDALIDPVAYVPVDVSEEHLLMTADDLRSSYPGRVHSPKKDAEDKRFTGLGRQGRRVFNFDAHVFRFPVPAVMGFGATELR